MRGPVWPNGKTSLHGSSRLVLSHLVATGDYPTGLRTSSGRSSHQLSGSRDLEYLGLCGAGVRSMSREVVGQNYKEVPEP